MVLVITLNLIKMRCCVPSGIALLLHLIYLSYFLVYFFFVGSFFDSRGHCSGFARQFCLFAHKLKGKVGAYSCGAGTDAASVLATEQLSMSSSTE